MSRMKKEAYLLRKKEKAMKMTDTLKDILTDILTD